ncbi:MAG: RHS repeat protein, partial [Comamonadaceae bacterium]
DENGNLLYQTVYVTQQQQVWVPESTPAPTLVVTTPPYAPGYTVAARPAQYALSRDAMPSSVAISGGGATVLGHAVATNDGDQWLRPAVLQKSDRWGNVLESTDPRFAGWKTTYAWNANNQMVGQTRPDASGGSSAASPVVRAYYDKLGRQVAARDANGNVEGQVLDSAGNLVQERHADTGVVTHRYDAFGDRVSTTDALGNVATHIYDRMGRRLSTTQGPVALYAVVASNYAAWQRTGSVVDSWTYDQLGRKLSQTNGNGETIRYGYDLRGNLLSTRQPLGQVLRATYDAQGRKTGEVDGNGYATTWTYDYFGRLIDHGDLGGAKSFYSYDNARQLVAQSSTRGQSITYGYDAAGQQTSIVDAANAKTSTYTYDLAGRRLREKVVQAGVTFQDNHLSYDAQGNLRDVADARVHIAMDY